MITWGNLIAIRESGWSHSLRTTFDNIEKKLYICSRISYNESSRKRLVVIKNNRWLSNNYITCVQVARC